MTVELLGKPEMTVVGDLFRLSWSIGIDVEVERIAEHRDELTAEITVASRRPPRAGLLHRARFNLMSSQARKTLGGELQRRDADIDWPGLLEQLCFLVVDRYRAGEPSRDLREDPPELGPRWLLEPFVERGGATILFADGGTGKSMLGLAIAASIASGEAIIGRLQAPPCPVLFLDWESDHGTAHERLRAICAGAGLAVPAVFYRRQVASLAESAAELRREALRVHAGFAVIDSLGAARGGEPESADVTIRLFVAARSLGIPWLGIDHVTKANGNQGSRPFGSAYSHNLARVTWGADKAQEEGEDRVIVSLRNFKRNNGRLLSSIGYRIDFESDADQSLRTVTFGRQDLVDVPAFADKLPLRVRILAGLRSGPLTPAFLADAIDADEKGVAARVSEMVRKGELVRLEDKRVALAARTA